MQARLPLPRFPTILSATVSLAVGICCSTTCDAAEVIDFKPHWEVGDWWLVRTRGVGVYPPVRMTPGNQGPASGNLNDIGKVPPSAMPAPPIPKPGIYTGEGLTYVEVVEHHVNELSPQFSRELSHNPSLGPTEWFALRVTDPQVSLIPENYRNHWPVRIEVDAANFQWVSGAIFRPEQDDFPDFDALQHGDLISGGSKTVAEVLDGALRVTFGGEYEGVDQTVQEYRLGVGWWVSVRRFMGDNNQGYPPGLIYAADLVDWRDNPEPPAASPLRRAMATTKSAPFDVSALNGVENLKEDAPFGVLTAPLPYAWRLLPAKPLGARPIYGYERMCYERKSHLLDWREEGYVEDLRHLFPPDGPLPGIAPAQSHPDCVQPIVVTDERKIKPVSTWHTISPWSEDVGVLARALRGEIPEKWPEEWPHNPDFNGIMRMVMVQGDKKWVSGIFEMYWDLTRADREREAYLARKASPPAPSQTATPAPIQRLSSDGAKNRGDAVKRNAPSPFAAVGWLEVLIAVGALTAAAVIAFVFLRRR